MRRLRASEPLRNLVRETHLEPSQFIFPLFVVEGEGVRREIGSMPGNYQLSIDELLKECETTARLGIGGVMLFGIPSHKDETASGAYDENGIVQQALRALKQALPKLVAITDVCNCEYTSHGHCGKVVERRRGQRRHAGMAGRGGGLARPRWGRYRGAVGHDGRARRARFGRRWMRHGLRKKRRF
jgi:delta-aminolevulinic acid dehydratase/porphobilinogen synthase